MQQHTAPITPSSIIGLRRVNTIIVKSIQCTMNSQEQPVYWLGYESIYFWRFKIVIRPVISLQVMLECIGFSIAADHSNLQIKPFIHRTSVMNRCRGMLLSQRPLLLFLRQQANVQLQQNFGRRYMGHTVRIIITDDVSEGKLYAGEIATVKAGYARNFLIPQKKAVYATRQNFLKLDMKDPELETAEERFARLQREATAGDDQDVKAADILRKYLSNKVVRTK